MGVLRILLAVSVIASHSTSVLGSTMYPGNVAVQIFFMISGFYMTLVLDARYKLTRSGLLLFYSNRALRLYPAFLVVMLGQVALYLLTWLVIGHAPGSKPKPDLATMSWALYLPLVLSNWFLVGTDVFSNLFYSVATGARFMFPALSPVAEEGGLLWMHEYRPLGHAWSIGTEIWFYLLAPFLVRLRWQVLSFLFLGSFAVRWWIMEVMGRNPYFFFPAQLLFFIAGVWACQWYRKLSSAGVEVPWAKYAVWLNWAMVVCYPWYEHAVPQWLLYVLVVAALPLMFMASKDSKRDRFIGDLSYALYLVHLPVQVLLSGRAGINSGTICTIVSGACALLIVLVVEKPVERFRRARVSKRA